MWTPYINKLAFVPPRPTYRKESVNVWIQTPNRQTIPAFHIRHRNPITLLVAHANAEDLGLVLALWSRLAHELSVDVFAYEYPGYGHATGEPSEAAMYDAASGAIAMLRDGFGLVPERDIVLHGKSIGSCPTCYLASKHKVRGVILVSPLASGARVLFPDRKYWLADAVAFNNLSKLRWNRSPVHIIHGTHDETVPFSHGEDLYEACRNHHPLPPGWLDSAGHNNVESVHVREYLAQVRAFLDFLLANPPDLTEEVPGGYPMQLLKHASRVLWSCGGAPLESTV